MLSSLFQTLRGRVGQSKYRIMREAHARIGSVQEQEVQGLLPRPNYAYGMFRAASLARFLGQSSVTICEFGVATGNGLVAMIDLASRITPETGVEFRIVGFDTGEGLPEIGGYEDHPELWSSGDFAMFNKDELTNRIAGRAELNFGDIKDTVGGFVETLTPQAPLGFISVDVDIYTATRSALRCLEDDPLLYTPAVSMYFDDLQFFFANRWCGELLAIDEFNAAHDLRKIDQDRGLVPRMIESPAAWHSAMYAAHILDHPTRTHPQKREGLGLKEHLEFTRKFNLS